MKIEVSYTLSRRTLRNKSKDDLIEMLLDYADMNQKLHDNLMMLKSPTLTVPYDFSQMEGVEITSDGRTAEDCIRKGNGRFHYHSSEPPDPVLKP